MIYFHQKWQHKNADFSTKLRLEKRKREANLKNFQNASEKLPQLDQNAFSIDQNTPSSAFRYQNVLMVWDGNLYVPEPIVLIWWFDPSWCHRWLKDSCNYCKYSDTVKIQTTMWTYFWCRCCLWTRIQSRHRRRISSTKVGSIEPDSLTTINQNYGRKETSVNFYHLEIVVLGSQLV